MPRPNSWFAVTGGPAAGKTTTLDILAKRGYHTLPEAARVYIDEGLVAGESLETIRKDETDFQLKVLDMKLDIEKRLDTQKVYVFDRGMQDSVAYLNLQNYQFAPKLLDKINQSHYALVFFLEQLPNYTEDYARSESPEQAQKTADALLKVYEDSGLKVVRVPVMSPEERADFIQKHIEAEVAGASL